MKFKPMLLATISLSALVSSACSGLAAETMVPDGMEVGEPHRGSVRVDARGMKPVGDEALAQAVGSGIAASKLFESVAGLGAKQCDWVLSVTVKDIDRDEASLGMTSRVTLDWSLRALSSQHVTWSKTIATEYTATPDDTEFVEERGRIATTRAMQDNIKRALEAVSKLELD